MKLDEQLLTEIDKHPYPVAFLAVSGAHLFGFPSSDSDYDVRGPHILPAREVLGLNRPRETIEVSRFCGDLELDLVTHDLKKYFGLIVKKNGNVLEQIHSPLVVRTSPEHEELRDIARRCVTRHHHHHYLGFARNHWELFEKSEPRRVKPLLYVYRLLLVGTHLMRTGEVESNIMKLNEGFKLPYISDLVSRKVAGPEKGTLDSLDFAFHQAEYERLCNELKEASEASHLPEAPEGKADLSDLLIRMRMAFLSAG